jgi:hypothetical protein
MQPQPGRIPQQQPRVSPKKQRQHWLVYAGLCLFVMLFGWIVFTLAANWWRVFQDDWHYGRPRTFHLDADVGHGGMSHFTVENLSGQILVTEIPLHDQTHAKLYSGPQLSGENAALAPATLAFEDVNGDGFSDMILIVEDTKHVFLGSRDGFKSEIKQEGNR